MFSGGPHYPVANWVESILGQVWTSQTVPAFYHYKQRKWQMLVNSEVPFLHLEQWYVLPSAVVYCLKADRGLLNQAFITICDGLYFKVSRMFFNVSCAELPKCEIPTIFSVLKSGMTTPGSWAALCFSSTSVPSASEPSTLANKLSSRYISKTNALKVFLIGASLSLAFYFSSNATTKFHSELNAVLNEKYIQTSVGNVFLTLLKLMASACGSLGPTWYVTMGSTMWPNGPW